MVAAGTTLTGNVELNDDFHLDGVMKGNLTSKNDLIVSTTGRFTGDVKAKRVLVSGVLDGKVDADRLEIVASGQVSGEIKVRELVIESGGQFVGASQVKKHDTPRLTFVNEAATKEGDTSVSSAEQNQTA
ncbi:MAG: polymer-forming cytoskeletal protein [Gammaproteobacteria bacterium]|nr:polymer-forming cytoskeletal protein [Gammaproteobacteria bacterium]MBU1833560.1 polymer-forming cytoskeletal protein [Gammaproteobacteria bacterium]